MTIGLRRIAFFIAFFVAFSKLSAALYRQLIHAIMTTTTHPEFNAKTEALEVAEVFNEGIRGKTILVTGGNPEGIGFATCQAFVGAP